MVALIKQWEKISPEKIEAHFVVAHNNSDFEIVQKAGYSFSEIPIAKLRRYFSWQNFLDFFTFFANLFRAFRILKKEKPDFVFSKGGFVSLPVGLVAKAMNIPFYLHETDSTMGLANRILARFAKKVFTGFPSKNSEFLCVGNPVREEFFLGNSDDAETNCHSPLPEENTKNAFEKLTQIFIFGGSQGAHNINKWSRNFFSPEYLKSHNMEVLLVTGKGKIHDPLFPENSHANRKRFHEVEFLHDDFSQKIHEADIVITRAGGSISELAAAEKAVVLIPLPSAANNHQLHNAQFFAEKNAAFLLEEKDLYSAETQKKFQKFLESSAAQKELSQNIKHFAPHGVAEKIWTEISG